MDEFAEESPEGPGEGIPLGKLKNKCRLEKYSILEGCHFFNHPACAYDPNPIEDQCGWMARDLYRN